MLSISHKSIKVEGEDRIDVITDKIIINPEIDCAVERYIEVEETLTETIDHILEVDHETIIDKMIGETVTDRIIEEPTLEVTTGKIMDEIIIESKGIEIGVQVEVGIVSEVITEIIQGRDLSKVEILAEIGIGKDSHDHELE